MSTHEWITVFVTSDEIDANLKKGLLESEGIECIIEGNVYRPRSVTPLFSKFKLNVLKDNKKLAEEILKSVN